MILILLPPCEGGLRGVFVCLSVKGKVKKEEKKMKEKKERINVKRLVYTYMDIEELELDEIKNAFEKKKINIKYYLICKNYTKEKNLQYFQSYVPNYMEVLDCMV
jgi:hypothetical protein